MTIIDLVYFNAGGGHRAAARAIEEVIARERWPWRVRLIDLARVLDPAGNFRRFAGFAPEEFYNTRLRHGWTFGLTQELKLLQGLIRLTHRSMLRTLSQHWAQTEPDLVVSLVPNFNRVLCESVAGTLRGVPFVTVLTDMADHPPHFWIERGQTQTLVCGTPRALEQALAMGHEPKRIALTSGMPLRPSFYDAPPPQPRAQRRLQHGLDPHRPTAVVMFGGQGSAQALRIARELDDTQLVMMCGRNEALLQRARRLRRSAPHAVFGFTDDVANVMRLGDFLIGKPGPGSLSEAVHLGLPVITLHNRWTMPQERYNAQWVREQGVGLVIGSLSDLPQAVRTMVDSLPRYREATERHRNRAVFEIPMILADCLQAAAAPQPMPSIRPPRSQPQRHGTAAATSPRPAQGVA